MYIRTYEHSKVIPLRMQSVVPLVASECHAKSLLLQVLLMSVLPQLDQRPWLDFPMSFCFLCYGRLHYREGGTSKQIFTWKGA